MARAQVKATGKLKTPDLDEGKFRELVIYVANKCGRDIYFGATKLNKILFYSDFMAYYVLKKAITGAEYKALDWGPVPTVLKKIRAEMDGESIAVQKMYRQERIIALREADLSAFSSDEIALVDRVIDALRDKDADAVSRMSHALLGWKAALAEATDTQVVIPYSTIFVSNPPLDEFEKVHGLELAGVHGWKC